MLQITRARRAGSSLCEVLVALTLVSAVAAAALTVTAASERIVGQARQRRAALHRVSLALATMRGVRCDSAIAPRTVVEPRWQVTSWRDAQGSSRRDRATIRTARGDTLTRVLSRWCT
jgi:Tfp pilus assembly protein PilV